MKRRTFVASVNGLPVGRAFAYNAAMRKGEAFIRSMLSPKGSAAYLRGHLDRETMVGWKDWTVGETTVRIDVAPQEEA